MFTGIIECVGTITGTMVSRGNIHFTIESPISGELKVDQSVSHDGVCLTVVHIQDGQHTVTAIQETLSRTNLQQWKPGKKVNLERCMPANGRFDGHIVQGHVDCTAILDHISDENGSFRLRIKHPESAGITVEKGSITVNGISLTVTKSNPDTFEIAIIPYTWEHTNLSGLQLLDIVNIEFDIVGKYIEKLLIANPMSPSSK